MIVYVYIYVYIHSAKWYDDPKFTSSGAGEIQVTVDALGSKGLGAELEHWPGQIAHQSSDSTGVH